MRVLVTGGAGYIGSHTVKALVERGDEVVVVDDLSTGHREFVPSGVRLAVEGINNTERIAEILASNRIEAVIHFAAKALVGEDARNPASYYATNVGGTLSILDAMVRAGVRRIVFSSSCSVYGEPAFIPITEDHPLGPLSIYGETKRVMEKAIEAYSSRYDITSVALRYFNAAGAASDGTLGERHQPETHLIPRAIKSALHRGRAGRDNPAHALSIFGQDYPTPDGTPLRDYVHVEDLAAAHVAALGLSDSATLNLGTGVGTSVKSVIALVERYTGCSVPTRLAPRRAGDPARLVASFEKAASLLGWRPQKSIDEIVESAAAWERKRP